MLGRRRTPSASPSADQRGPTAELIIDGLLLAAFAALLLCVDLWAWQAASPMPWSDESAHLAKLLDLQQTLQRNMDTSSWAHALFFSGDAYPNLGYAVGLPFLAVSKTIESARASLLVFTLAHAGVAAVAGRLLWGRAGAWAYIFLACVTPITLAYSNVYLIDVTLTATVGISLILLERSDGFRRPLASMGFALAAACGLYAKWTWFVFLAVPLAVAAARAFYGSHRRWAVRLPLALGFIGTCGLACWLILLMGESRYVSSYRAGSPQAWVPVASVLVGLVLATAWGAWGAWRSARAEPLRPLLNLSGAAAVILAIAAPWYILVQEQLWGRLEHEETQWVMRGGNHMGQLHTALTTTKALVPFLELLLPTALVIALLTKTGGWAFVSRLIGTALALGVLTATLPYDTRYLLPLAPILAGACVASWRGLPPRPRWVAAVGVCAVCILLSSWPTTGAWLPGKWSQEHSALSWTANRLRIPLLTVPVASTTTTGTPMDAEAIRALIDAVHEACDSSNCMGSYAPRVRGIQGRALAVLVRYSDIHFSVQEPNSREANRGILSVKGFVPQHHGEHRALALEPGELVWTSPGLAGAGILEVHRAP